MSPLSFHSASLGPLTFECVVGHGVAHSFPMHVHQSLCIGQVTRGCRLLRFPDREMYVKEGKLFLINSLQPHATEHIEPHDYTALTVTGLTDVPFFDNNIPQMPFAKLLSDVSVAIVEYNDYNIKQFWQELFTALSAERPVERDGSCSGARVSTAAVSKALAFIAKHYGDAITVGDIADHACLSVFHFCRLFKACVGMSPHQYLLQYRLSRSHSSLRNNQPVFDVAIDTGFYDSSHFVKTFTNVMAISPQTYQKSILKNSKNLQR